MKIWEENSLIEVKSVDSQNLRFCFKDREKQTNKGTYGQVLCVCGSYNSNGLSMAGAAILSARAAFRCGSGLVRVFTHRENYTPLMANLPEAVAVLYDGENDFEAVLTEQIKNSSAVLVGCGLGKSELAKKILTVVLKNVTVPLIIDADGLNILSEHPEMWDYLSSSQRKMTVITPHPGEMSRLCGLSVQEILADTVTVAKEFSQKYGVITLLKEHNTVISDGNVTYINHTGNPGMAKAGSGDVLSGIICSMLGNKALCAKTITEKVALGAYLHGAAGDIAAEKHSMHSLLARDIAEAIGEVLSFSSH